MVKAIHAVELDQASAVSRIASGVDRCPSGCLTSGHPLRLGQVEVAFEVAVHVDHAPLLVGQRQVGEARVGADRAEDPASTAMSCVSTRPGCASSAVMPHVGRLDSRRTGRHPHPQRSSPARRDRDRAPDGTVITVRWSALVRSDMFGKTLYWCSRMIWSVVAQLRSTPRSGGEGPCALRDHVGHRLARAGAGRQETVRPRRRPSARPGCARTRPRPPRRSASP